MINTRLRLIRSHNEVSEFGMNQRAPLYLPVQAEGSVSIDPLQALRILIWLLRVIGQTFRIHPIEYTDTMYQLD